MPQILLLGASVRALAIAARRGGWSVCAADMFLDRDLVQAGVQKVEVQTLRGSVVFRQVHRYPTGFLVVVKDMPQIPWMYTGGLENYPRLLPG